MPDGRDADTVVAEARRTADLVHGRLVDLGCTVGVAESLTGGMISMLLTDAPGTSVTFRGAIVAYSTDLKHSLVGVRAEDLEARGAVDPRVVAQLATGARERLSCDYGVGVTGVAGPGTQDGGRVGEVHVAVASPTRLLTRSHDFGGTRAQVRAASAAATLADLLAVLQDDLDARSK